MTEQTAQQSLALARKWRPRSFETMVGQEHVLRALINALNQNRLHHAYLFTGTRGVGKTTVARIIAKCLNCETNISATPCEECNACQEINAGRFVDLIEVDAASRTKVEDIRELLDNVQYAPTKGRYKVYLIDEVHMLSGHSFNALLKTLEEPPPSVIFLLATTDPQKLPVTVLSRCLQFHLKNLEPEQIESHLNTILDKEQIPYETSALAHLARAANGSMRDGLSLLDQAIAYGNGDIKSEQVQDMLGTISTGQTVKLLNALKDKNANDILAIVKHLSQHATDFSAALEDVLLLLHRISILQIAPDAFSTDWEHAEDIKTLAATFSKQDVQLFYQIALLGRRDLPLAPSPKIGFEMVMLRMLAFDITFPSPSGRGARGEGVKAPAKTPSPQTAQPTVTDEETDWQAIVKQLPVIGPTKAIIQHCELKSLNDNKVELILDAKQSALFNAKQEERIQKAFTDLFKKDMQVKVTVSGSEQITKTPAKQQQNTITQDQNVQAIMNAFDANIVPGTVTTTEEN